VDLDHKPHEKRVAVRIDSRIKLGVRKVEKDQFLKIKEDYQNGISLYNRGELSEMRVYRGGQEALARVKEKDRDLAMFLQQLDAKIDLFMRKVDAAPALFNSLELQKVNLGGLGLGFWGEKRFTLEDNLEINIVLPGDNYFINCFGEVVDSREVDEDRDYAGKWRTSVKFTLISENDRETLVRYNFRQQSKALEKMRLSQSS